MPLPSLAINANPFQYIPEYSDDFLALFPHRYDFLWAKHYNPGEPVEWHSENRHPLSDRLINQGAFLYGVRFDSVTRYLMADIDTKSLYHPSQDPFALSGILTALEALGLYAYIAVSSSYSGGIHLYFPFGYSLPSWMIAHAAQLVLENAGFSVKPGQLELFPNSRGYGETLTNYNGHRLPLQAGSYLLNADWQPIFTTRDAFVQQWRTAQNSNHVDRAALHQVIAQNDRFTPRRIRQGNASKFLADLNAEIEQGWTGFGQTNHILGRIAIREYVFRHTLCGSEPLKGGELVKQMVAIAMGLPGYEQWCRHQCELIDLCTDWARCVENSHYYPYGSRGKEIEELSPTEPTWNEQQAEDARARIKRAVAQLQATGQLPDGARARLFIIRGLAECSANTLYRNKDLWHPDLYHSQQASTDSQQKLVQTDQNSLKPLHSNVIHPSTGKSDQPRSLKPLHSNVIHPVVPISLYGGWIALPKKGDSSAISQGAVGGSGGFSTSTNEPTIEGVSHIRQVLTEIASRRALESPPTASPPPDEEYFLQLQLTALTEALTDA